MPYVPCQSPCDGYMVNIKKTPKTLNHARGGVWGGKALVAGATKKITFFAGSLNHSHSTPSPLGQLELLFFLIYLSLNCVVGIMYNEGIGKAYGD